MPSEAWAEVLLAMLATYVSDARLLVDLQDVFGLNLVPVTVVATQVGSNVGSLVFERDASAR